MYHDDPPNPSLVISVTQEDIDSGTKKDCRACAVARAINRHLKPEYRADIAGENRLLKIGRPRVYEGRDEFITQYMIFMYHVSSTLIPWINAWDKGEPVQPFRFTIPSISPRLLAVQDNP